MVQNNFKILHLRQVLNLSGILTLLRLPLTIAFSFAAHRADWALVILFTAAFTDIIDGKVARWQGTTSHLGAFLDGWLDKIFNINAGWALVIFGWMPWWVALLLFTREWFQIPLVPYYVSKYTKGSVPTNKPHWSGKACSIFLVVSMAAALLSEPLISLVTALVTASCGFYAIWIYLQREFDLLGFFR